MPLTGKTIGQLDHLTSSLTGNEAFPIQYSGSTYHISQSQLTTGSLFGTASWASNALTASLALQVSTSISTQNQQHNVLFVDTSGPGYIQVDGGLRYNPNQDLLTTTASFALNAATASSADNFTVRGTLTAQTIVAQVITSSTNFITGSTRFGSLSSNIHQFTGSLSVSGSSTLSGKLSINTPTAASAIMEVTSTTQGFLPPRMTTTQRDAISSPDTGLQIFNTTRGYYEYYDLFWGWMPVNINQEWQGRYGIYVFDSLSSSVILYVGRTGGTSSNIFYSNFGFSSPSGYSGGVGLQTGTTSTGYATLHSQSGGSNPGIYLGYGIIKHQIQIIPPSALSNATDEYIIISGFNSNSVTAAGQTTGCFFTYDRTGASNGASGSINWQVVTRNASVSTVTDTSVTVSTSTLYLFEIQINYNASSVTYFINGVSVATHTTNIPTTAVRLQTGIFKTVGTSSVVLSVANATYQMKYNTAIY